MKRMSYQFSNTTSLSDETYLEAFVESISSSIPNEMRRNLEHLRDLDNVSTTLMENLRDKQDECLIGVEESLVKAFGVEVNENNDSGVVHQSGANTEDGNSSVTPTRDADAAADTAASGDKRGAKRKQPPQEPPQQRSSEKKVACTQCRSRKVKCDGRQPFCLNSQALSPSPEEERGGGGKSDALLSSDKSSETTIKPPPASFSSYGNNVAGKISASPHRHPRPIMRMVNRGPPTSDEIESALATHYPNCTSQRQEITSMYHELQQLSDEKIKVAHQLKAMIDMTLGRLNRDFEKFEKELGIDPSSIIPESSSANNIIGVSLLDRIPGVGLGMINHHHALASSGGQRMMTMGGTAHHSANSIISSAAESGASNNSAVLQSVGRTTTASATVGEVIPPHTLSSSMQQQTQMHSTMRGSTLPPPNTVQTTNLAAIKVTPNSPDWILAKIISFDKSSRIYTLSDEDVHSNDQIYKISEKQVVPLKGTERNKWARGDAVYAVYPDTTSFYHATVSTPPFNGYVMVHFKDDWDANGVTHEKAVLVAHVMKVPPGGK